MVDFQQSETKKNLMRAFAGESQARNRYTFAADAAKKEGYQILHDLFIYTANQEKAHAWQFMKKLKECSGEEIEITSTYPAEVESSSLKLLKSAVKHESAEHDEIYKSFAEIAKEEGFMDIYNLFNHVASVEKVHSERFSKYATMLENGSLFKSTSKLQWMCTNCGYIYEGESAPATCPLCSYPQDYYIRFEESPFENK